MANLTKYEKSQVSLIEAWENKEPSVVSSVIGTVTKPISWLTGKMIPDAVMEGALNFSNAAAGFFTDEDDIRRDGHVGNISELRHKDLQLSDKLADEVHNWAIGAAAATGAGTGVAGVAGIIADVPALITMSLRTIQKIGLCYGYRTDNEMEKSFVRGILSATSSNKMKAKLETLFALRVTYNLIEKTTWKKMGEIAAQQALQQELGREATVISIKALAKQLGINITKRSALKAIPIVGAAVGAVVSGDFLRDVGYAAIRTYQKRWLADNGKLKF